MSVSEKSKLELVAEIAELSRRLEAAHNERKRMKEELEYILDYAPVLVCVAGLDGYYKRVNPAFERILGHTEEESLSKPFMEFIHPDDRERANTYLGKLAAGEPLVDFEDRNICRDGTYRWISWTVIPVPDRDVVYGIGHDVTARKTAEEQLDKHREELERRVESRTTELMATNEELVREVQDRKKAEETLRQSEQEYRHIFESAADSLFVGDLQGRIVAANPAACEAHGYTHDEIVGLPVKSLIHPDYHRHFETFLSCIGSGGRFRTEAVALRKDGSTFPVDVSGTPFLFKGKPHLLAILRDITDKVKSDEALREREEVARALINAPTESFLLVELDGTIVTLNETAAKRFGGTVEQLTGTCVFDHVPPDVAEKRRACGEEVVRTGKAVCIEDSRAGQHFHSCGYPVFDADGNVIRFAIYAQDVSERRAAEEAVEREQRHLRHSMEASDRERRLIAYDIHDGLAQHLSAAIMQFQAFMELQSQNADAASKTFDTGLKMISQALAEARRLIGGVRPPILDEMGVVMAVQHLVSGINGRGGPEIELEASVAFDRLPSSFENTVFRIIQESLSNACMHSHSEQVRLTLLQNDRTLRIEIQDWGVGFDTANVEDGSFGLDGIRERARLLGGKASIQSTPGEGTHVIVEVPLEEGETEDAP